MTGEMHIQTQSTKLPVLSEVPNAMPARQPVILADLRGRPNRKALRLEHRQAQRLRVEGSARLAEKYPRLKSLTVSLEFVEPEGISKTTGMKYSVNPEHARSVFLFSCPNRECIGGDFDLTAKLAAAVAAGRTKVAGEMHCLGNHKRADGKLAPCRSELRYTLSVVYSKKK